MLSYLAAPLLRFYPQWISGASGHILFFSKCAGLALAGILLIPAVFPSVACAVKPEESHTAGQKVISLQKLVALQAECATQIVQINQAIQELTEAQDAEPFGSLIEEIDLWERLELLAAQLHSVIEVRSEIADKLARSKERHQQLARKGVELPRPYSFLVLDEARDQCLVARRRRSAIELELKTERSLLIKAKDQLVDMEHDRRLAKEAAERGSGSDLSELRRELSLAELNCRVLKFDVMLHREHLKNLSQVAGLTQKEVEEHEIRVQLISKDASFAQRDLDQRIAFIDAQEKIIREQLNRAETRLRSATRSHSHEKEQVWGKKSEATFAVAREEVQLLQQVLSEVGGVRECWRRRFAFANGDCTPGDRDEWLDEALAARQRIEHLSEKVAFRTAQRQNALSVVRRSQKMGEVRSPDETVKNEKRSAELEHMITFYGSVQDLAGRGQILYGRFCDEIYAERETMSLGQFFAQTKLWLEKFWSTELGAVDDRPITVSKVVCGLALLLGGYWLSRFVAKIAALKILPRMGVSQASAAPLRNVFFYFLLAGLTFFTLDLVNVPLTVFAFLGGAIAIGVGFGSQNILNNFISGLILLVERPIRIGDLVNVDGIDANIEQIGARSTCVRTGANLEILVPNSKFLENNVTNWTLSDTQIRTSVAVGVAYGSSVKRVIELLKAVVTTHEKVLPSPAPIVLFRDFADNALAFEVHFWIHMQRMMDSARVESDVRVAIDEAFCEAGIVIAFPQRDVHVDLSAPIDVRLSEPGDMATRLHRPIESA